MAGRQRERAVPQRPRLAVALAQFAGLDDVHATPSAPPPAARARPAPPTLPARPATPPLLFRRALAAAGLKEIPQPAGEQGHDPVLVKARRVGRREPAEQGPPQARQLGQRHLVQGGLDERALARAPGGQALVLKLAVGLQHRVRVDGQRGDHVPDLGQLVTRLEVAKSQRVLHLLHELQVGRHPRVRIQPELDRAVPFIYCHRTRLQTVGPGAQSRTAADREIFSASLLQKIH